MKNSFYTLLFVILTSHMASQSLTGTNGLFKIPSAYIAPDGYSYIGASFLPNGSYGDLSRAYSNDANNGLPTFITISLYNRVEFMFRYTHVLGIPVNPITQYFPDRMFTFRYNLFKERHHYPATTIGLHDVSGVFGGTSGIPFFLATYVVASKTLELNTLTISPTLGYSYDLVNNNRSSDFKGIFAGIEIGATQLPYFTLVGEYDSEMFNVALKTTVLGHLHFAVGLLDMQALSGFFTYRFNLSNR